jgi:hypothetical protein
MGGLDHKAVCKQQLITSLETPVCKFIVTWVIWKCKPFIPRLGGRGTSGQIMLKELYIPTGSTLDSLETVQETLSIHSASIQVVFRKL